MSLALKHVLGCKELAAIALLGMSGRGFSQVTGSLPPPLTEPYRLTFKVTDKDPRTQAELDQDTVSDKAAYDRLVKQHKLDEAAVGPMLQSDREAWMSRSQGEHYDVTVAVANNDILYKQSRTDPGNENESTVLIARDRCYHFLTYQGKTSVRVSKVMQMSDLPYFPFLSSEVGAIPIIVDPVVQPQTESSGLSGSGKILMAASTQGPSRPLPYNAGTFTFARHGDGLTLSSLTISVDGHPSTKWTMQGDKQLGSVHIPVHLEFDTWGGMAGIAAAHRFKQVTMDLQSAEPLQSAGSIFVPETYAHGAWVAYGLLANNPNFAFKDNGRTIEEQAGDKKAFDDSLLAKDRKAVAPSNSFAAIVGLVIAIGIGIVFLFLRKGRGR